MRQVYMRDLKRGREHRGLSQADLGRLAGCSDAFISMPENGKKAGSLDTLERLAAALHVSTDQLLGMDH